MSRDSIRCRFTLALILLTLLLCAAARAEEARRDVALLVVWTDDTGAEQSVTLEKPDDGESVQYTVPMAAFPSDAVQVFRASGPDTERVWLAVTALPLESSAEDLRLYALADDETADGWTATLCLRLEIPESGAETVDGYEPTATPDPSVTIIVHYQTADGMRIAEDETYQGLRGTAVPVYARQLDEGWILTGEPLQYLNIEWDAPSVIEASFIYMQPTPTPVPPEVTVTVHYLDIGGAAVASDTVLVLPGGTMQSVEAAPQDLRPDYYPNGETVKSLNVNSDGAPQELTFYYEYRQPVTPAPASAVVQYVDETGQPVAQSGLVSGSPGQEMTIYAAPEQLMDFYVLDDEPTQRVVLPESGETVTVTFRYRLELPVTEAPTDTPAPTVTPTPQPARVVGFVQVSYTYQGDSSLDYNEPVTVYEGETVLDGSEGLRTGYHLISAETVTVTLTADGIAEPKQIAFVYAPDSSETLMPELIVQYFAEDGTQVATSTLITLHIGENIIYASPVDLMEDYEQITPSCTVMVDNEGNADQALVTFYCRYTAETTGQDSGYQVMPASGYARAKNDSVNLRSSPSTASDSNRIATISKTDIIEIKGTAQAGGKWYYVSVNGRQGYVSASVVTELTEAEVQVLLGLNTSEDETGETGLIERWGELTKTNVRVRKAPAGKEITKLAKGTRVFVDEMVDVEGTLWCRVRYNKGKEGYIKSDCLKIYSAAESQMFQSSLASPVPTHTVPATRVPTSTPTVFIPTATPTAPPETPAPILTATPVPYTGYAITNTRTAVRGGLSADNAALATINGETLVMVQGQTYINDVCWDSVLVVSSGITGFIEDDKLFHVTNEMAQDYLESLATPTPQPTPENTPIPFIGYALIQMNGVPLRQQMNSNAQYISILQENDVVSVLKQSTMEDGSTWCLVQSNMYIGYVRRDLLRQMTDLEIVNYLEANNSRPTATPAVTPTPRAQSAMPSCWGIISPDRVHLRSQASLTQGTSLRLMSKNEFVQVQGTLLGDDELPWMQVMFEGQIGYIRSDYVQILSQGELTSVVTSEEFRSANTTETAVTGVESIQSYETYLANQWTNPSLTASYEPFNPYVTPAAVGALAATATPTPAVTMPPTPEATIIVNLDRTPQPNATGGNMLGGVLIGAGVLALGGGAFFIWQAQRAKKRREALQRAQAIRRKQQTASETEPQDRHPKNYRRDATASYPLESMARPAPGGESYRQEMPGSRQSAAASVHPVDGGTRQFQRPQQDAREAVVQDDRENFEGEWKSPFASAERPQPSKETPGESASSGRRRRTARNQYDEDGN